ncbi:MAG TPA: fibronectin type III domain-containing protein [Chryseolinea sp.]|nr:fibronectin type III domain-containing protein [Chryseolinea sp.]
MKMLKVRINVMSFMVLAFSLLALSACEDDDPSPVAPAAPVLNVASEITATGFKASWAAVPAADKYLLDVSLAADFATTVTGYAKKEVTGTSHAVTGLTAATKYYFRLYAKDGSLTSVASTTKDATTLP